MALDQDTFALLISSVQRFVRERLMPAENLVEEMNEVPPDIIADMCELGLFGLSIPEAYGGIGLAFTMLNIELGLPNVWKLQQGNTVFITHRVPQPGWGYFRALNADTAPNFLENSKVFIDAAYKAGFDNLVTQFDDPTILNIFKMISRNPPRPQMGYKVDRTNVGGYQVQVKLGPSRIKEGKK